MAAPAPPPIAEPAAVETDMARCEALFVSRSDPLHRALLAQRLVGLRQPRELATGPDWPPDVDHTVALPPEASGLHRPWHTTRELTMAYHERGRLQAAIGDAMSAMANELLAREHRHGPPRQTPSRPSAGAVAAPPR